MNDLIAARSQMALSLGFHIVFACIGMVMPFFMARSHWKWLKTGNDSYYLLTKTWSRGVAIFFVVGAVSGTALSFELGLLWPEFMKHAGPIFGMPFSLEGTAFFIEAIALGLYLYGWKKIPKWLHWFFGVLVGISGILSGILVVAANAWMNSPTGFDYHDGVFSNIDPIAAMFNKAWLSQALHMFLASFVSVGFAVAGLHAWLMLKYKQQHDLHIRAFRMTAFWGCVAAILQPLSGDFSAKDVAERQPVKLAAMEAVYETEKGASLLIGGIVNEEEKEVHTAIEIPGALSFLAYGDFDAEVKGLNEFPEDEHPPVAVTHYAFQIMVGIGSMLMGLAIFYLFRRKKPLKDWLLKVFVFTAPLGFIATEAGWTVTEVGRQPWIIYGIMKTKDAVTPVHGIQYSFMLFLFLYLSLSFVIVFLMQRQVRWLQVKLDEQEKDV